MRFWLGKGSTRRSGLIGVAVMVTLAVLIASCSGDSDDPFFDPARADELTHAAMITPDDLPGAGWEVVETDNFSSPDLTPLEACGELVLFFEDTQALGFAGRAQKRLDQAAVPAFEVGLEITASEADADERLSELVERLQGLVSSGSYLACLAEAFPVVASDPQLSVTAIEPSAEPPEDGAAVAYEVNIQPPGTNGPLSRRTFHVERYVWSKGNVIVEVEIEEPKQTFDPEFAPLVLEKVSAALTNAARSD
jgi:hypothetical protein